MRYLLFLLLLSACGVKDTRPIRITNEEFRPYISLFERYLGRSIGDVPIDFMIQDEGTAGSCNYYPGDYRFIAIDQEYWEESMDETSKINLIFHELGHCVLNLEHDETKDEYGMPKSFMYPTVFLFDNEAYMLPYYQQELFE